MPSGGVRFILRLRRTSHAPHHRRDTRRTLLLVKLGPLGPVSNNAYIVADTTTNEAVIIDAPAESAQVIPQTQGLNVRRVIVTHRHRDHWGGIDELLAGINVPVYTHEQDREPWAQYVKGTLDDGETVEVGGLRIDVIHTPGHTQGHICLRIGEHLLSGDTLFPGGPGRTQTPELWRRRSSRSRRGSTRCRTTSSSTRATAPTQR